MAPPVQPESKLSRLEATIKAWFDEVMALESFTEHPK